MSSHQLHGPFDPLLATKLYIPRPRRQLVLRPHLVDHLQQGMDSTLTLISAPAGFGKTTLLAQWLSTYSPPVAWLSFESQDNDPLRFLTYLIAALQTQDPQLGMNVLALLEASQSTPLERALTVLTNDMMQREREDFALVLDDYHVITAKPIHQAMAFLLDHLPPQIHLFLSTRADPPLPLSRLRARGQLIELRSAELRLNTIETETFLHTVMGLDLPIEAIAVIESRTEGWVAGLQLAGLSLRGRDDVSTFLESFTGTHRFVLDYLSQEVLSQQPEHVQSFLLHTSILEHLNGSLCDAVTGQEGGQGMLETLDRTNLFVVSLDEERRWYRYHHLFAELLKSRLSEAHPSRIPELHLRASTWFEHHDQYIEAVQHALAAYAPERAITLIEQCAMTVLKQGQTRILLGWLDALPDTLIRVHPLLSVYYASVLHLSNQVAETEVRLQDAERGLLSAAPSDEQARTIRGFSATVRANIARYSGDLVRYVTLSQEALAVLPETQVVAHATATMQAAHSFFISGDATFLTEQQVKTAIATTRAAGYPLLYFRSLTLLGRLHILQGRLKAALTTYREAGQETPREILQVLNPIAVYSFELGNLLCELNRLDEAERLVTQGMKITREMASSFADDIMLGYLTLARLQHARGEAAASLATLSAFAQLAHERRFLPELSAIGAAVHAQFALAQGNLEVATAWAEHCGLSPNDADIPYQREREYLTLARVCIEKGREHPTGSLLQEVLHLLDRLLREAKAKARLQSVLEILIVRARVLFAQANQGDALTTFQQALILAEPEGYIRLFVDEGPSLLTLLRQAQARGIAPEYVARLLSVFGEQVVPESAPSPAHHSLLEPLTEREREVLLLLSEGASNNTIARRLVVSVNTVKRHVYNICSKLGVQSRTQAIARARTLHLI